MKDSGTFTVAGVTAKKGTDKASGVKMNFTQAMVEQPSETLKSLSHRERTGKLTFKVGGKQKTYEGMLMVTERPAEKMDETGEITYTFKPGSRPSSSEISALYDAIDSQVDFIFQDSQKKIPFADDAEPEAA